MPPDRQERSYGRERAEVARAVVLEGHGLTSTGPASWRPGGRRAPVVPAADRAELPDLGSAFNDEAVWRAYLARLAHLGLDVHG